MHGWDEVGDRVLCRRYQPWDVSVGVVLGTAGVLVVDTRASLDEGGELAEDVARIDPRRPLWVVNTHWHFDHVGGNARFAPPAEVWGHVSLPDRVDPPPGCLVDHRATIDLGDRLVELRHLGRGHTDGDVVITVAGAGVTFAGDLVEESGPPAFGDDSFPLEWPATAARLVGMLDPEARVVPGHGRVVDRRFVADQQRDLAAVADAIRHLWVGEVPLDTAVDAGRDRWPWPPDVLAEAVARGYRELDVSAERGSGG